MEPAYFFNGLQFNSLTEMKQAMIALDLNLYENRQSNNRSRWEYLKAIICLTDAQPFVGLEVTLSI